MALLPHVGNLTRNVVIRSENPSGTRGHTLFTHRSTVAIHYVQFQDLGRTRATPLIAATNHIGRYPLHIHHLWGPVNPSNTGYQFEVVGNAINDSLKWPIAVHGSHYGLVKQNVVFGGAQLTGAGIAVEDGTETENLFEENFVANIRGGSTRARAGRAPPTGRRLARRRSASGRPASTTASSTTSRRAAATRFSRSSRARVGSSSCRPRRTPPAIRAFAAQTWPTRTRPSPSRRSTSRSSSFAATKSTVWPPTASPRGNSARTATRSFRLECGESLIKDFRVWHTYEGAIYNYPAHRMTVDGLVYRVDPAATLYWPSAFQCGDYRNVDVTIRNGSIHAGGVFGGCTDPLGHLSDRRCRRRDLWARLLVRDSGDARHRCRPSTLGRDDDRCGTTESVRGRAARCRRSRCSTTCRGATRSRRQVRVFSVRLPGPGRATTSGSTSTSRRRRTSTAGSRRAPTRRPGRRSTASAAR